MAKTKTRPFREYPKRAKTRDNWESQIMTMKTIKADFNLRRRQEIHLFLQNGQFKKCTFPPCHCCELWQELFCHIFGPFCFCSTVSLRINWKQLMQLKTYQGNWVLDILVVSETEVWLCCGTCQIARFLCQQWMRGREGGLLLALLCSQFFQHLSPSRSKPVSDSRTEKRI